MSAFASPLRALGPLALLAAAALGLAAAPSTARAKTILVVVPHSDDETLLAGGVMYAARLRGDTVKIAIVTNGEGFNDPPSAGVAIAYTRQAEAVAAAQLLGGAESDVIFLGYGGDSLQDLYHDADPDSPNGPNYVRTSEAGRTQTYANRGLGLTSWHQVLNGGAAADYTHANVLADVKALFQVVQPDEVYTMSAWDWHPDHTYMSKFIAKAISELRQAGEPTPARIYEGFVWNPGTGFQDAEWPCFTGRTAAYPFPEPPNLTALSPLEWSRALHVPVPAAMRPTNPAVNLKAQALELYASQINAHLRCFVYRDEFFWHSPMDLDVAMSAAAGASSFAWEPTAPAKAINGVVDGDGRGRDYTQEWKTGSNDPINDPAWLQLRWAQPVRISQVNLWDRLLLTENVLSGTLVFSDGSSIAVGALPADGTVKVVTFDPKTVVSVTFHVDSAAGNEVGLAEMGVYGVDASSSANVAPRFLSGPVAASSTITSGNTTTLSLAAWDLDGDPVSVTWAAPDGGTITPNGTSATFTAPSVIGPKFFAVTATLDDGNGGTEQNVAYVLVYPGVSGVSIGPAVAGSGTVSKGLVRLTGAAPTGGTTVSLSSSNPATASVGASVTVPAGKSSAAFDVQAGVVTSPTTATITADFGGSSADATLLVLPNAVAGLALDAASVQGGFPTPTTATVTLAYPSDGSFQVTLAATDGIIVPASVTVASGQTTATFDVSTSEVLAATTGHVTASGGGASWTVPFTRTAIPAAARLTFASATLAPGGTTQATVTLNQSAADEAGATVTLVSSDPAIASVPATVTVPFATSTAQFTVTAGAVSALKRATISATLGGTAARARVTVSPP